MRQHDAFAISKLGRTELVGTLRPNDVVVCGLINYVVGSELCAWCLVQAVVSSATPLAPKQIGLWVPGKFPPSPFATQMARYGGGPEIGGLFPLVRAVDGAAGTISHAPIAPSPLCGCTAVTETASVSVPAVTRGSYRARTLDEILIHAEDFTNWLTGMVGPASILDLELETTAKVSGSYLARGPFGVFANAWGGHVERFSNSTTIGILEGLERKAAERPTRVREAARYTTEEIRRAKLRSVGPSDFGWSGWRDADVGAWTEAHSFVHDRTSFVPELLAYYNSRPHNERVVNDSSSGTGSGSSFEEATFFGALELVERDGFLASWYGGLSLDEIVTSSMPQPLQSLIARLALIGYRARFFDATLDLPIPIVVAVAERLDGGLGTLCFGAGAHPDASMAAAAALSEIASDVRVSKARAAARLGELRQMAADFSLVRELSDHADLASLPEARKHARFLLDQKRPRFVALKDVGVYRTGRMQATGDLRDDLSTLCTLLEQRGLDLLAVDITIPGQTALGVHCSKVLIPGLLPIDFGWHRQRALSMARLVDLVSTFHPDANGARHPLNLVPHPFP